MLTVCPDSSAILYPRLYGGLDYYVLMASCGRAVVDTFARYDKRCKHAHRFEIADTRGRLQLTVPVGKPQTAGATWRDIPISDHGRWWNVHRVTLESAYGRTPFFEFYIDRFLPLMQPQGSPGMPSTAGELVEAADRIIRAILGLSTQVSYGPAGSDLSELSRPASEPEYYQVRSASLGFLPGLSVLDAIFNLGPETPLLIRRWQKSLWPDKVR